MSLQRLILETGIGTDLYGEDYTKAACRAVNDAIRHSSLPVFSSLGISHTEMTVKVTVGVQKPEQVDTAVVAAELPRGNAEVVAVFGGQNIEDTTNGSVSTIATVGIEAWLDIDQSKWKLSEPD